MGTAHGAPSAGVGGSGGGIFGKTRVGWGNVVGALRLRGSKLAGYARVLGVGVMLGCPASSQGAGPSLGLAGRGDRRLGKEEASCSRALRRTELLPGWSFLIPCPSDGAIKAGAFGGLWNEVSPIVVSYRLDQNLRPQTRAKGANVHESTQPKDPISLSLNCEQGVVSSSQ